MVNDVRRVAHDLGALRSHDYGISGGSALYAGLALPSVSELGDTEETSLYQWISRLRTIGIPPMFGSALIIEQLWRHHAHFRTPYIAGVKARTCFLSIGLVMESAMFWFVLM